MGGVEALARAGTSGDLRGWIGSGVLAGSVKPQLTTGDNQGSNFSALGSSHGQGQPGGVRGFTGAPAGAAPPEARRKFFSGREICHF